MPDGKNALVNIFTTSLAVLKTINFPHNSHPEAQKRWAVLRSYKAAHNNPTLNVKADPKQKKKKATATEKSPKTKKADNVAATQPIGRPTRASTRQSRSPKKAEKDDDDYNVDDDDLDEDSDSFDGDKMALTSG